MTPTPDEADAQHRGYYDFAGYAGQPAPVAMRNDEISEADLAKLHAAAEAMEAGASRAKPWDRAKDARLAAAVKQHVVRCGSIHPVSDPVEADQ